LNGSLVRFCSVEKISVVILYEFKSIIDSSSFKYFLELFGSKISSNEIRDNCFKIFRFLFRNLSLWNFNIGDLDKFMNLCIKLEKKFLKKEYSIDFFNDFFSS